MEKILRTALFWIFLIPFSWGNGLQITNLTWNQASQTLTFDIQWFNAWHVNTVPNNWDAAWIFVKFRQCGSSATTDWTHGLFSTNLADHNFGAVLEPVLSDGSALGIEPAPNNTGVLLRPVNLGNFDTLTATGITIRVTNLPTTGTYDVKVFGIEMVYIPQGPYLLGALDGWYSYYNQGAYSFSPDCGNSGTRTPYNITSENAVTLTWAGNCTGVNVPATFPKGFNAFHCMKYEISQGQYAAFLNTIPAVAAANRYPGNFNTERNRLTNTGTPPNIYFSDRPDRAQNFLTWHDLMAYLDWAALRPMTEMEFEKICRGTGPSINGEYAWGSTSITAGTTLNLTPENGTEEFSNVGANATYNNVTYTGGDGGRGPVRVGIHAKINGTRESSGAAFYGVLDMSGNVWERCVAVHDNTTAYDGRWGDGYLDAAGLANATNWFLPTTGNNNPASQGVAFRGGSWYDNTNYLKVSNRYHAYVNAGDDPDARYGNYGGRGVR